MTVGLTLRQPIAAAVVRSGGPSQWRRTDMHTAYEVGVVAVGHQERNAGSGWYRVDAGSAYTRRPLEPHQIRHGPTSSVYLVFYFLPALFGHMPQLSGFDPTAPFRDSVRSGAIELKGRLRRAMVDLANRLVKKYRPRADAPDTLFLGWRQTDRQLGSARHSHEAPGQLCLDLLEVLRIVSPAAQASSPTTEAPAALPSLSPRIQPALDLLNRSSHAPIGVEQAARACRLSRSTFQKLFSEATGMGFHAFGLRLRLSGAAHALATSSAPIKDIASQFGFVDACHFHHTFRAYYHVTPGQHRTSMLGRH